MSAQDLINAWGRKKYDTKPTAKITFELDDKGGSCPTCGYTDIKVVVYADHREVGEVSASIAEMLAEILGEAP